MRPARAPAGSGALARRRRGRVGAGARGARPPHGGPARRRLRDRLATGRRPPAARARPRALRGAPRRAAAAVRRDRRRRPERLLPRRRAARGAGDHGAAAGDADAVGAQRVGRLPGLRRPRRAGRGAAAARRAAVRRDRRDRRGAVRRRGRRRGGDDRDPARGGGQDVGAGGPRPACARDGGDGARRPRGGARRRRRRRRCRLLRGDLPARRAGRPAPDDAGGPGRLRLRRQDRRRPARGQELRRRVPPAVGGAGRSGGAGHAPAARARRGLGRGDQDRADRGRRAVGARARSRRGGRRRARARVRAHEAGGRGAGRARPGPAPGAQPRPHGRARDRDRDRIRALPPRRGGRAGTARRAGAVGPAGAPRRGRARCWRPTGCRSRSTRRSTGTRCSPRWRGTRSAAAAGSAGCWSRRRATSAAAVPSSRTRWRALWESWGPDAQPGGGDARRQPRRARPAPSRALRRADVLAAGVPDRAVRPAAGARGALLPHQPRGRVRRGAAQGRRLRRRPAAQPGRLDALRVVAARRGRADRPARGRGAPLRRQAPRAVPRRLRARGRSAWPA